MPSTSIQYLVCLVGGESTTSLCKDSNIVYDLSGADSVRCVQGTYAVRCSCEVQNVGHPNPTNNKKQKWKCELDSGYRELLHIWLQAIYQTFHSLPSQPQISSGTWKQTVMSQLPTSKTEITISVKSSHADTQTNIQSLLLAAWNPLLQINSSLWICRRLEHKPWKQT